MRSTTGLLSAVLLITSCWAAPQQSGGDLTSLIQDVFQKPVDGNPNADTGLSSNNNNYIETTTANLDSIINEVFNPPPGTNNNNNNQQQQGGGNYPTSNNNQGGNFPAGNQGGGGGGNYPTGNNNQGGNFPAGNQGGGGGVSSGESCSTGVCVPYYQCQNGSISESGAGLIDIRVQGECSDYLEVCCSPPDRIPTTEVKIPTNRPPIQRKGCGQRNPEGVGFRITGAKDNEAQFGEFPWMVAILKEEGVGADNEKLNVYQCGGALIHPQIVLTAAHCVIGKNPAILKVRAGEWDTQTKNEVLPHQDRGVKNVLTHENYHKGALYNDFGLLVLSEPVDLTNENVGVVCLPETNDVFDYSRCFASGWGKDIFGKEGHYQVILKRIELPVVPRQQCQNALRTTRLGGYFTLHNTFICAGGEAGKDTCKGDGGSPLVCPMRNNPMKFAQAGIVAWGIGCGENQVPGVYASVATGRDWIYQQAQYLGINLNEFQFN